MAEKSTDTKAPISLPKGGGAIRGIGETFQPNLFSGTGNFSVPIFTSPGRNGFGPTLTLQYSTGNGNGPFGLGWQLSIPRVTRKTEKGLPTYKDEDVFVMSGAEDLVPQLARVANGPDHWEPVVEERGEYTVGLYRPRTEGQFNRMEKWVRDDGDVHWRAITPANVTSIYGHTPAARLTNPESDPEKVEVFEWLLEETFDARGNHILYEYIQEDPALTLPDIYEQNRSYTQAYIRRILYGNTPETLDAELKVGPIRTATDHWNPLSTRERHYVFEVLFEYGDLSGPLSIPTDLPDDGEGVIPNDWPVRADPFSTFRAGFEIRTLRRCERVLMLHHFKEGELNEAPLVKSTDLEYTATADTNLSLLSSVTISGYRRDPNETQRYLQRSLPPLKLQYSVFEPHKQRYQSVTAKGGDLPPHGLNQPEFTAMDLFGDGLPDILQAGGTGFYYWQNLGQGQLDRRRPQPGDQPSVSLAQPNVSIADMGGDGLADLMVDAPPMSGFYESTPDGCWSRFKRFDVMPSFSLSDPNTRLVDLTGDGLSDVLVTRDQHFLWYRCRGEAGYDEPLAVPRQHDLATFPDVYFDDPSGRVRLADMSGDGLNDIVLVHDGRIDYWPNMGYGRFGPRITMANPIRNPPRIGYGFDPKRLFLVDLDGTGCADLVYVDFDRVHFWFNQSGNAWSEGKTIHGTPPVTDLTALEFNDFYGTGTATLVWSYDYTQQAGGNYKILDFCGGQKPHLLVEMDNNMGATTRVQYAPSTKFYLEDKANGTPWITNLPFPVHVLEKAEVLDHISKTKLVTTYKYHHGYYDGREREFRGFGRVDQFDTEIFTDFSSSSLHGEEALFDNGQREYHVPPVETRTWFHTGVYFDPDRNIDNPELTKRYRNEYYNGDNGFPLDDHVFDYVASEEQAGPAHEAYRVLRGAILRTEVYGRDGSDKASHPYTVTENRHWVKEIQPHDGINHAVYLTLPKETMSYHYERNPADPRISATLTLSVDDYGNITDSVSIGYPRRVVPEDLPEQAETKIIYTRADFINKYSPPTAAAPGFYYARIPCQTRSYEVTGIAWQPGEPHLTKQPFSEIQDASIQVDTGSFMPYEWQPGEADTGVTRRIIEWTRKYFRTDADPDHIDPIGQINHRLSLGDIESLGLPYEDYSAAFTNSMLQQIYGDPIAGIDLASEGGYHPHPNHTTAEGGGIIKEYWWVPSGRQGFNKDKFFKVNRSQDPFGNIITTESDVYAMLLETARDALPAPQTNVISAKNDYRVLQPFEVTDPNKNRSQVAFDALGMVVGTAVMGKSGEKLGDSLADFNPDLTAEEMLTFVADPLGQEAVLLNNASTRIVYDLGCFMRDGQPPVSATLARETHVSDLQSGQESKIQVGFTYSDGFAREIQKKIQAEPGPVPTRDAAGNIIVGPDGQPQMTSTEVSPRWVGSGWTLFNNKGKPVRQFEPFFTDTHNFEFDVRIGVSPVLFYDPLERVVATLHPDHSWEKVVFDPWRQESWDVNDTVLFDDPGADPDVRHFFERLPDEQYFPTWHALRVSGSLGALEQSAANKTAVHAETPTVVYFDSLGRTFLTVAHNKFKHSDTPLVDPPSEEFHRTRLVFDIEENQREVIDALDRVVVRYDYDMLSNRIHQASMEAGERWMLNDVAGQPIRAWDSRDHEFRTTYDQLRRPAKSFLVEGSAPAILVGRTVYGESETNPETLNRRGKAVQLFDQAGVITSEAFDFKGNLLRSQRQLAEEYKKTLDWSAASSVALEGEVFRSSTSYDALNRPITLTTPDNSVIRPTYNEANLLERIDANLRGAVVSTPFVTDIDYNAKGQRTLIVYGNGVETTYTYDPNTFRLIHLRTMRGAEPLQDLHYTYDPAGNITHIQDDAQQTIFFRDRRVEPSNDYIYDAVYRLIEATGREHLGQTGGQNNPPTPPDAFNTFHTRLDHPGDGNAMGTYIERYFYDDMGNFLSLQHRGNNPSHPGWTRTYDYDEPSLLEPTRFSNRLSRTTVGTGIGSIIEPYRYDGSPGRHGSMTAMPHLPLMQWDFGDQLNATAKQVVNNGVPEITYYVYDAGGQRVRKVTERAAPAGQLPARLNERIYLGVFETFREYDNDGATVTLERETLQITDGEQRIALIETRTQGNDGSPALLIRHQLNNHLGSASVELNDEGQIISYEEYYSYGSSSYQAVRNKTETPKRYRYTGKERDEETGFSYHGVRYYAPWLSKWVSADPAGTVDGYNLYAYGRDNPIGLSDPRGTDSRKVQKFKSQLEKTAFEEASLQGKVDDLRAAASDLEEKLEKLDKDISKIYNDINSLQPDHKTFDRTSRRFQKTLSNKTNQHAKATGKLKEITSSLPSVEEDLSKKTDKLVKLRKKGVKLGLSDTVISSVEAAGRSRAALPRFARALAKLGPLGTLVGIATGVSLLAQGKVWAAAKEFAGTLPLVGDIIDLIDLGGALVGWLTGSGKGGNSVSVGDTVRSAAALTELKSQGWKLIAVTWDEPSGESPGESSESSVSAAASEEGFPRFVALGGGTILQLTPRSSGGSRGLSLPMSFALGEWWKWDEYKILEFGILGKKLQLLPTQQGLTLQSSF